MGGRRTIEKTGGIVVGGILFALDDLPTSSWQRCESLDPEIVIIWREIKRRCNRKDYAKRVIKKSVDVTEDMLERVLDATQDIAEKRMLAVAVAP
jgi:hypothetical protein